MKAFRQGTPAFGIFLGILFVAIGALWMTIGFWKTLLLLALFLAGYFLGAVSNKEQFVKDTVNRVIPEKKDQTIDLRDTLAREREESEGARKPASREDGKDEQGA